jgi:hypothetical protein
MTLKIWEPLQFHVPKALTAPPPRSGSLKIPETKGQDYSGLVNSQCILWPVIFFKNKNKLRIHFSFSFSYLLLQILAVR